MLEQICGDVNVLVFVAGLIVGIVVGAIAVNDFVVKDLRKNFTESQILSANHLNDALTTIVDLEQKLEEQDEELQQQAEFNWNDLAVTINFDGTDFRKKMWIYRGD